MKRVLGGVVVLLMSALMCIWALGAPQNPVPSITASVVSVVSLDTVDVEIIAVSGAVPVWVGDTVRIRLMGIEPTAGAFSFWEENVRFFAAMLTGKTVYLAVDSTAASLWTGGEEPLLAYVYLDPEGKTSANSLLINMGFAQVPTTAENEAKASAVQEATSQAAAVAEAEAASTAVAEAASGTLVNEVAEAPAPVAATPTVSLPEPSFGCCDLAACVPTEPCQEILRLICLSSPVRQGDYARLRLQTVPEAWCQIDVRYHSGLSTDLDLSPRSAFCGYVTWRWKVTADTPAGTWPIVVTARLDGKIVGQLETAITVRP